MNTERVLCAGKFENPIPVGVDGSMDITDEYRSMRHHLERLITDLRSVTGEVKPPATIMIQHETGPWFGSQNGMIQGLRLVYHFDNEDMAMTRHAQWCAEMIPTVVSATIRA